MHLNYILSILLILANVCIILIMFVWFDALRPSKQFYQSPLILTELSQNNLINVSYLTACYLYQVMMTLHFLNDIANDVELTQKSKITLVWRVFNNG